MATAVSLDGFPDFTQEDLQATRPNATKKEILKLTGYEAVGYTIRND